MSKEPDLLLSLCLAGGQEARSLALELARAGVGARHYCAARGVEPLAAAAGQGWDDVVGALLERAFYDPHESALDDAFAAAARAGRYRAARLCAERGATLGDDAIESALDAQGSGCLRLLLLSGHLGSDPRWGADELSCLLSASVERELDELARLCVERGAQPEPGLAERVASGALLGCARAWLERGLELSASELDGWREAFPALMISRSEARELAEAVGSGVPEPRQGLRL